MKHIVSWSGGKDSTATIILAHEKKEPLDIILFSEVMFDKDISGELPKHIQFVKDCIPLFESWGYQVEILHHDKTYMDYFNQVRKRGKNIGKKVGFPMADKCNVRNCKVKPIEKYLKQLNSEYIQYIGYAADETKRLCRLKENKLSLLAKYHYTEQMAFDLCKQYGLLSPYYAYSKRGGCWFCPNARGCQLENTRNNYPDLWESLLELENEENLVGSIWNTQAGISIREMDENLYWEGQQLCFINKSGGLKCQK